MFSRLRRSTRGSRRERGSMAIEVVALAPVLVLVLLFVVAVGKWVDRKADVEAIARDAARAASLERDIGSAQNAADQVLSNAEARLYDGAWCEPVNLGGSDFVAGGMVEARVTCQLPWEGFAPIGLSGSVEIGAVAESPLDQWRRTG